MTEMVTTAMHPFFARLQNVLIQMSKNSILEKEHETHSFVTLHYTLIACARHLRNFWGECSNLAFFLINPVSLQWTFDVLIQLFCLIMTVCVYVYLWLNEQPFFFSIFPLLSPWLCYKYTYFIHNTDMPLDTKHNATNWMFKVTGDKGQQVHTA